MRLFITEGSRLTFTRRADRLCGSEQPDERELQEEDGRSWSAKVSGVDHRAHLGSQDDGHTRRSVVFKRIYLFVC